VLQQEAAELLVQHFGEARRKIGLQARPNGQIMITGPVDTMETKLAVSRLFRQLPGCYGILNELIVEETLHNGKRVVPVTTGSLMVPVSDLQPRTTPIPPPPEMKSTVSSDTAPVEKRQPIAPQTQAPSRPLAPVSAITVRDAEVLLSSSTPRSGQHADRSGGADSAVQLLPPTTAAASSKIEAFAPMPVGSAELSSPVEMSKTDSQLPTRPAGQPVPNPQRDSTPTLIWRRPSNLEESEPKTTSPQSGSGTAASASLAPAPPAQTGRRWPPAFEAKSSAPQTAEVLRPAPPVHEVPRSAPPARDVKPSAVLAYQAKPTAPPVEEVKRSAPPVQDVQRPAPPTYAGIRSSPSNESQGWVTFDDDLPMPAAPPRSGQPGTIVFDDEPAPPRSSAPAPVLMSSPPTAGDLQRQIKAVCGPQAISVIVESQRDGSLDVRVKVPDSKLENQLTSKILAIPGMSSPKVHLVLDVGP
jgi:hypothetical protein